MEYLVPIFLGTFILMILTRPFTVLCHELGHAITLMLLTGKGATIFIGSFGNPRHSIQITAGKLKIWFRYNPVNWRGGLCIAEADEISLTKQFVYILGGTIFSLVIAGIFFYLTIVLDLHGSLKFISLFAFGSTIFDLFANLIPREIIDSDGKLHRTDGYHLVNILKWKRYSKQYENAIELYNNKEYDRAGALFEALSNRNFEEEHLSRLVYQCHIYNKDHEKAYLLIKKFNEKYTMNSEDYYHFGYVCSCLNLEEEQSFYFKKSLELNPNSPYALNAVGYEFNVRQQYQQAIPYFDSAIAIDNSFAYAYNNRGHARIETGRMEEGLHDINYSLQLDKENSYAYRNLGIYHLKHRQFAEAHRLFLKAKELDAETELIDELIAQTTGHM